MISSSRHLVPALACAAALALGFAALRSADAGVCNTGGAVGAGNSNARDAGRNDALCGQYVWFGYGYNYNNYCANAAAYAHAAGIGTTGTGACAAGTVYNYYAGGYHGQCRDNEFNNRGFDLNGYCSIANTYATSGICTGCQ